MNGRLKFATAAVLISIVGVIVFFAKKNKAINDHDKIIAVLQSSEFPVILSIQDYTPVLLDTDSDIFSSWGVVLLKRTTAFSFSKIELQRQMERVFSKAGWHVRHETEVDTVNIDLAQFHAESFEPLSNYEKVLSKGKNEISTRYILKAKLEKTGSAMIVFYRVDSE